VKKIRLDQWLAIGLICVGLLTSQLTPLTAAPGTTFQPLTLVAPAPLPVLRSDAPELASLLTAESVMVIDVPSGSVLFEKNAEQLRYPASTTKMMTALIASESYQMDHILTVGEEALIEGTVMGLQLNEQIPVRDVLHGLLLTSGNDAAFLLANHYPQGGYQGFMYRMNQRAQQLHLDNTHFINPSGLDAEGQTSSARDLLLLAKELMKNPLLREIVGTRQYTASDLSGEIQHQLVSSNHFLGIEPGVIGVKTGTTPLAGEILISEVQQQQRDVLIAVLGSSDRYGDTQQILRWLWQSYEWQELTHPTQSSQLPDSTHQ